MPKKKKFVSHGQNQKFFILSSLAQLRAIMVLSQWTVRTGVNYLIGMTTHNPQPAKKETIYKFLH